MRTNIIITVRKKTGSTKYDVEVPTYVPAHQLEADIRQVLCGYFRDFTDAQPTGSLYCERLQAELKPDETLGDAGIWSGDILLID